MHSALIITIRVIMYVVLATKIGNEKKEKKVLLLVVVAKKEKFVGSCYYAISEYTLCKRCL